jgi:hypothetical protein
MSRSSLIDFPMHESIAKNLSQNSSSSNSRRAALVHEIGSYHQLTPLVEDLSEDRLLEVLEEALAARVIEELPQAVGSWVESESWAN